MFPIKSSKGGGATISFPDVCKTPAPPAPFVPIPYPSSQLQENLKAANKADAMAKNGNKEAQKKQKQAIDNLYAQTGIRAKSATQAVMIGRSVNGKYVRAATTVRAVR